MSSSLTNDELQIAKLLENVGMKPSSATLAVVMVIREHARTEEELVHIVRQYQHLEDRDIASEAIKDLKRTGWIIEFKPYDKFLVRQSDTLKQDIASKIGDKEILAKIDTLRDFLQPKIQVLGSMKQDIIYTSYIDILKNAHSEICLPMLATTPDLSTIPILLERAQKGTKIKILLGTPRLVARLRGNTMLKVAQDSIKGWIAKTKKEKNITIKLMDKIDYASLATCMLIDNTTLRFDIYDQEHQRSLQGIMLEVISPNNLDPNIIRVFKKVFNEAWFTSQPTNLSGKIFWYFKNGWQYWASIGFAIASFYTFEKSFISGITGSISATFLLNALVASRQSIKDFFVNLLQQAHD